MTDQNINVSVMPKLEGQLSEIVASLTKMAEGNAADAILMAENVVRVNGISDLVIGIVTFLTISFLSLVVYHFIRKWNDEVMHVINREATNNWGRLCERRSEGKPIDRWADESDWQSYEDVVKHLKGRSDAMDNIFCVKMCFWAAVCLVQLIALGTCYISTIFNVWAYTAIFEPKVALAKQILDKLL